MMEPDRRFGTRRRSLPGGVFAPAGCSILLLAALLVLATATAAQSSPAPLPVEFDDVHTTQRVQPLGAPGSVDVPVAIGCDEAETPGTITEATIEPTGTNKSVNPVMAPRLLTWSTEAETCASNPLGTPHEGVTTVLIGLDLSVPAFSNVTVPLEMVVNKTYPTAEETTRTYGPYQANVSVEAGYSPLMNVQFEDKIKEVGAGDTAQFEGSVLNLANGESRITLAPGDRPEAVTVSTEPEVLTLASGEQGTLRVDVQVDPPFGPAKERHSLQLRFDSVSTQHPDTAPNASSEIGLIVEVDQPIAGVPGLDPELAALTLVAGALLVERLPRRVNGTP